MSGKSKSRGKPFVKGDPRAGRPRGVANKATVEVKSLAQGLLSSPEYQASLVARLNAGELAPAVESLLWHYAYGKPKETVEVTGDGAPASLTIIEVIVDAHDGDPDGSPPPNPASVP